MKKILGLFAVVGALLASSVKSMAAAIDLTTVSDAVTADIGAAKTAGLGIYALVAGVVIAVALFGWFAHRK